MDFNFEQELKLIYPKLIGTARRIGKDNWEDLLQDTIEKALGSIKTYLHRNSNSFLGWMNTICFTVFIGKKRLAAQKLADLSRPMPINSWDYVSAFMIPPTQDSSVLIDEAIRHIKTLSIPLQETFEEFYIQGKSCQEISKEHNITAHAVNTRCFRLKNTLEKFSTLIKPKSLKLEIPVIKIVKTEKEKREHYLIKKKAESKRYRQRKKLENR